MFEAVAVTVLFCVVCFRHGTLTRTAVKRTSQQTASRERRGGRVTNGAAPFQACLTVVRSGVDKKLHTYSCELGPWLWPTGPHQVRVPPTTTRGITMSTKRKSKLTRLRRQQRQQQQQTQQQTATPPLRQTPRSARDRTFCTETRKATRQRVYVCVNVSVYVRLFVAPLG